MRFQCQIFRWYRHVLWRDKGTTGVKHEYLSYKINTQIFYRYDFQERKKNDIRSTILFTTLFYISFKQIKHLFILNFVVQNVPLNMGFMQYLRRTKRYYGTRVEQLRVDFHPAVNETAV